MRLEEINRKVCTDLRYVPMSEHLDFLVNLLELQRDKKFPTERELANKVLYKFLKLREGTHLSRAKFSYVAGILYLSFYHSKEKLTLHEIETLSEVTLPSITYGWREVILELFKEMVKA